MGLQARYRSLVRKNAKLEATTEALRLRAERMGRERDRAEKERDGYKELYQALVRRLFGPRSERISPDQLQLEFARLAEEGFEAAAADLAEQTKPGAAGDEQEPSPPRSRHRGRRPLPADLPRRRRRYDLPAEQRACAHCAAEMVEIGEDVTEELEYEPASFYITEHARIKYACRACDQGIARAPMPDRPIEKGRPGPGLLAHIAVAKYGDHRVPRRRTQEAVMPP